MSLTPGVRLGAYEIIAALGAGGMGEVYRARDTRLGRDVAIKAIAAGHSSDPDHLQRFEQEARAAATLNHPNILAVYDIGTHDGPSSDGQRRRLRPMKTSPMPIASTRHAPIKSCRSMPKTLRAGSRAPIAENTRLLPSGGMAKRGSGRTRTGCRGEAQ
jgi:serine/threonine protein kinase